MSDPVKLTQSLVQCRSVTPAEGGAIQLLENLLNNAGFATQRVDRGEVSNLFARWGARDAERTFGFNGHTDVVPIGNEADWTHDPFGGEIIDGVLYGRGATDMKSGVAAFVAAAIDLVKNAPPDGAIVITITGDEEGDATDGTTAILDWMEEQGEHMDVCLVGEPTCPQNMGEMMKIGRRGSMTAFFTVTGVQGHAAYPERANNPLPAMARLIDHLASLELDQGTELFDPSTLAVTTIDTGNAATNVIPAQTKATVNIRFNDAHTSDELKAMLRTKADEVASAFGVTVEMRTQVSGESFYTPPGEFSHMVAKAVLAETGVEPVLSTSGGTSDARFIRKHCPVVEFGLVGKSMHKVDEHVDVAQIHQLKAIYARVLSQYFS